jgi:hypothetical protein
MLFIALSAANCVSGHFAGAATRRSIKGRVGGRYAADLALQLPARGAGSVALHAAFIGSTEHLVGAIARGYAVTVLRYARTSEAG